jgi:hypothetical protein
MGNALASDDDVALVYIRLVRKESLAAATILEQIHRNFGARAALSAALVVTLLKQEIQHNHSLPDIKSYTHLLKDYPEAIPSLGVVITCCLEDWTVAEIDQQEWEKWQLRLKMQSKALYVPFEYLIDHIRRFSPITAVKLEQIYQNHGTTAGGYAASALVWIAARIELFGDDHHDEFTERSLREFSYFEYLGTDQDAIDQFIDMLDCYRIERRPTSHSAFSAEHDALKNERQAAKKEENP